MDNLEKIWRLYAKTKDQKIKEKLILQYSPLIKYVAGRLSMHIGQHAEYEDLLSYGIFGLIDAIDKYDYDKGVKFETYASLRIRGAIIDNIRKLDWVPRTLRQKNKALETMYAELENSLGREPTDEEIAEKMEIPVEEVHDLIKKSTVSSLVSLDDYLEQNHEGMFFGGGSKSSETPEASYEKKEAKEQLVAAIEKLSEKEKMVVSLYYFDELTVKEISRIMSVSESRISQIHSKAVLKLNTMLGKYKTLLFTH